MVEIWHADKGPEQPEFAHSHVGSICYLCEKPIKIGQKFRFYHGPWVIHEVCRKQLLDKELE